MALVALEGVGDAASSEEVVVVASVINKKCVGDRKNRANHGRTIFSALHLNQTRYILHRCTLLAMQFPALSPLRLPINMHPSLPSQNLYPPT
jgi:hypothetical protein